MAILDSSKDPGVTQSCNLSEAVSESISRPAPQGQPTRNYIQHIGTNRHQHLASSGGRHTSTPHPRSTHRIAGKIVVILILNKPLLRNLLADMQLSQKQTRKLDERCNFHGSLCFA